MDESIGFRHRKKYRTCNSQINPGENKSIKTLQTHEIYFVLFS